MNTQLKMKTTKVCYAFLTVCHLSKLNRRKTTRQNREHSSSSKTERSSFGFVPTHSCSKSPFFSIIVYVERFALREAILVLNVPSGEYREARKIEKLSRFHTPPQAILGKYKTKIDALGVGSGSRRSHGKERDYEQSNQYMSRDTNHSEETYCWPFTSLP